MTIRLGSHVDSIDPLADAAALGAEVVQIFLGDPQSWKAPACLVEGGAPALKAAAEAVSWRTIRMSVAPLDAAAWLQVMVSKKKVDFIGKRSFARSENLNPLRKQFVGLLPIDAETVLPEGAQIIEPPADGELPPPPVPMLGHVTSSYRSAELGRTFALALVKAGRDRIGEILHVPVAGALVPVEVTGSVLVDPEGERRDG